MARRDSVTAQKTRRQSVKLPLQGHLSASFNTRLTSKGKRPQGIEKGQKQNPPRRSARLDRLIEVNETQPKAREQPLPSPVSDIKSPNVSRQRYSVMEDLTQYSVRTHLQPSYHRNLRSGNEKTTIKCALSKTTANILS